MGWTQDCLLTIPLHARNICTASSFVSQLMHQDTASKWAFSVSSELTLSLVLILEVGPSLELNSFPWPCLAFCICSYCHQWLGFHTIGFCLFNHFNYTIDINCRNYPQK